MGAVSAVVLWLPSCYRRVPIDATLIHEEILMHFHDGCKPREENSFILGSLGKWASYSPGSSYICCGGAGQDRALTQAGKDPFTPMKSPPGMTLVLQARLLSLLAPT